MPLERGGSRKVISNNIRELYQANDTKAKPRPRKQIVAIALSNARKTGGGGAVRALPRKKGM